MIKQNKFLVVEKTNIIYHIANVTSMGPGVCLQYYHLHWFSHSIYPMCLR